MDIEWFGNKTPKVKNFKNDFSTVPPSFYKTWDVVILLAGYSGVQQCTDMHKTYLHNVEKFVALTKMLNKNQRFIYASSGSVYNAVSKKLLKEVPPPTVPMNPYDATKQIIDLVASQLDLEWYGLRFGAVCGYSPNPRVDIMINKMLLTHAKEGKIKVANSLKIRSVLGLQDLVTSVEGLCSMKKAAPGFYNITSINEPIGVIARATAEAVSCPVEELVGAPDTYSFGMNASKIKKMLKLGKTATLNSIIEDARRIDFSAIIKEESKHVRIENDTK
jgi:nucleoside-diphosphate-sugar epimerase